jgi:TrmH family RNA methyltransferase
MSRPILSQTQARRLRTLRNRRQREESGLFLAEGIRVVEELVASPIVIESALVAASLEDTARGRALLARIAEQVPILATTDAGLRQLAETETPQGIVAVARIPSSVLPAVLPARALVTVLDGVQDPGNVGTLVRGADAFGAAAVVALPGTVDFWNGKTVRSAAGGCFRVPLVRCTVPELEQWAGALGVTIWGTAAGGVDVASLPRPSRLALVLGNEGAGLGQEASTAVSEHIAIPIREGAESLNVAMAGTVLMYLLTRAVH